MQILSVQPLRGPNLWSNAIPLLIQVKLDFTQQQNLSDGEVQILFDLAKANCPFLQYNAALNVTQQLTWATAQLAIYLQKQATFNVHYLAYKPTIIPTVYNVVFQYQTESIGVEVIEYAGVLINLILEGKDIKQALNQINEQLISSKNALDIDLQNLIAACETKQIPFCLPDDELPMHIGYGVKGFDVSINDYKSTLSKLPTIFNTKEQATVPIIAITGSNGKTTTTRLIAHIFHMAKYKVGFTTSDGIYVDGLMIDKGDTTGPASAQMVLRNKNVEVAVLESARGGIVRAGLGFKQCDFGIVTNVQNDHLGIADIETMEALAQVKQVIVNATKKEGFAILNADNPYTLQMAETAKCNVALFSANEKMLGHNNGNQKILFVTDGKVYFQNGSEKTFIIDVNDIPITFNGRLAFMTQNALAAILTCLLFGIDAHVIAKAVSCFYPSEAQTPGRMNIYKFKKCQLLVDFAHNPEGFAGIAAFLKNVDSNVKIGIIVGTGDRKIEDIKQLGKLSAGMFDVVLIHQVKFLRGHTADEIVAWLVEGMQQENASIKWQRIPDEAEPLLFALNLVEQENTMIVALSDVLNEPADLVKKYQEVY